MLNSDGITPMILLNKSRFGTGFEKLVTMNYRKR